MPLQIPNPWLQIVTCIAFIVAIGNGPSSVAAEVKVADEGLVTRIDNYLSGLNARQAFSGSVALTVHGEMLLSKGYGLANRELGVSAEPQTKFRIGSVTKQFTAMAIMILQERGELNVTDLLGKHLREVPAHWAGVTLYQLLTHTSGIMHSWALPGFSETMMIPATLAETLERFHDEPLLDEPGASFSYSGVGYFLLARVIEVVSGIEYGEFLKTTIFAPLGMADSGSDRPDAMLQNRASGYAWEGRTVKNAAAIFMPILTGGGDLYSTVEDLILWDRALTAGRLIAPASYAAMYRGALENYAFGWVVGNRRGQRVLRHGGGVPGFRAHILRIPNELFCVVVLSNSESAAVQRIANELADMVLGRVT